jgi:septal ring factor EnvC (AmiA/AmiB activator)
VDYSGLLKGYGEILILNHGSRFFTIHAHITQRQKQAGEVVEAGEVICLAAKSDAHPKPRLYFEIRRGSKSLDPFEWLQVKK